jgi:hypothetical protein
MESRQMRFLAIYIGVATDAQKGAITREREQALMADWERWVAGHASAIVEEGAPLGRTKRVDRSGISDVRNDVVGYTVVTAASHEEAAKLFVDHPHPGFLPGNAIEIMECLTLPTR